MPTTVTTFNQAKGRTASGELAWVTTSLINARLVLKGSWTPNADNATLAAITAAGASIRTTAVPLTGKTMTVVDASDWAVCSADAINFGIQSTTYDGLLLAFYADPSNASLQWPIVYFDFGTVLTVTASVLVLPAPTNGFLRVT